MSTEKHDSISKTVSLLISNGNYELALQLSQYALEKLSVEMEANDLADQETIKEIEIDLTRKYLNSRSKIDNVKRSYLNTFIKTLIVSVTISITIALTSTFIFNRSIGNQADKLVDMLGHEISLLGSEVKTQIPAFAKTIKGEIPAISEKIKEEIEKKTMGLDERFYYYNRLWEIDKEYSLKGELMPSTVLDLRREIKEEISKLKRGDQGKVK